MSQQVLTAACALQIALTNKTTSSEVYAYVTGLAIDRSNAWFLLESDGKTGYYPTAPSSIMTPISTDCAILLGAPGTTRTIEIPHIAGGRIYLSVRKKLTFFLNPGPALVEPSVSNPSDPNYDTNWGFCEFTWNADQLYANISYVDFVSLPIALTLVNSAGTTTQVRGMPTNGLTTLATGLITQSASDKQGWDKLIVKSSSGSILRILSPNQGIVMNGSLLSGYYEPYVDEVWAKYTASTMTVDTQASFGAVHGKVANNELVINSQSFSKPSTASIFNASSGPFATGSIAERNTIIPRLNAAFNRSTLLTNSSFPAPSEFYYKTNPTNHYARLVHSVNLDGRGYAFPYDDVAPSGGGDQSGFVNDGAPKLLIVTVGGLQDTCD